MILKHIFLSGLVLLLAACWDYSIELPNRYVLTNIYGDVFVISESSGTIILGPSVEKYQLVDNYIIGFVSDPDKRINEKKYFIVDTEKNDILKNMLISAWDEELNNRDINEKIDLKRPSRF